MAGDCRQVLGRRPAAQGQGRTASVFRAAGFCCGKTSLCGGVEKVDKRTGLTMSRRAITDYPPAIQEQIALSLGNGSQPKSPVAELHAVNDPLEPPSPAPEHSGRYVVRIVSFRRKPLDRINLYGGCKYFEDGCKYAGLISDDREAVCDFSASQVLVKLKSEERTEITVESPGWTADPPTAPAAQAGPADPR